MSRNRHLLHNPKFKYALKCVARIPKRCIVCRAWNMHTAQIALCIAIWCKLLWLLSSEDNGISSIRHAAYGVTLNPLAPKSSFRYQILHYLRSWWIQLLLHEFFAKLRFLLVSSWMTITIKLVNIWSYNEHYEYHCASYIMPLNPLAHTHTQIEHQASRRFHVQGKLEYPAATIVWRRLHRASKQVTCKKPEWLEKLKNPLDSTTS